MKIVTTIVLILFGAVLVSLITAGLVLQGVSQNNSLNSGGSTSLADSFSNQFASSTPSGGGLVANSSQEGNSYFVLNTAEVAKHNSTQSCWLIISGKVYDVTSYLGSHPGGSGEILKFCGQDGTVAFQTKDGRGSSHSSQATSMLAQYYIGDLNQKFLVSGPKTGSGTSALNPLTIPQITLNQSTGTNLNSTATSSNQPQQSQAVSQTQSIALTSSTIASHNNINDCWLIISGKVYNVTSFIPSHPGGSSTITPYCGQDATVAFQTKGGQGSHSQNANNMLASYYIGDLNQQVNQSSTQTASNSSGPSNTLLPVTNRGGDDDD